MALLRKFLPGVLLLSACSPQSPPPAPAHNYGASVAYEILGLGGVDLIVTWIGTDPERRYPTAGAAELDETHCILTGFPNDRLLHFYPHDTRHRFDVALLDGKGTVLELHRLDPAQDAGFNGRQAARFALFLRDGWLARHRVKPGDAARTLPPSAQAPRPIPEIRVGGRPVRVELSYRDWERQRGLMRRPALSPGEGMLFLYPYPRERSFWMLHCHLALDIAHFDADGTLLNVVSIDPYPDPETRTGPRAPSAGAAQYVLEVPRGWFVREGLADQEGRPVGAVRLELPADIQSIARKAD